jgi:hypothetical protein
MEQDPQTVAREAAVSLAAELAAPELPAEVESILTEGPDEDARLDGVDAVSIATLLVAAAQLAVAIYLGLTGHGAKTKIEITDELGRRLNVQTDAPPEKVEKIIRHTVDSMFKES